jgi:hypothetical protein
MSQGMRVHSMVQDRGRAGDGSYHVHAELRVAQVWQLSPHGCLRYNGYTFGTVPLKSLPIRAREALYRTRNTVE